MILVGNARAFSAGADLNELDGPVSFAEPSLHDTVIDAIEAMPMPVIAAMDGSALGGGLELSMACHYRIATPKTLLGLPEVTIGLMPGAGGTQRLPRAVGLETGLNLMLSGKVFPAAKAPEGLVDKIAEGDLVGDAVAFAREVADQRPLPLLSQRSVSHPNYEGYLQFARGAAKNDPRRAPGLMPIIDAVAEIFTTPVKQALQNEFKTFHKLAFGEESAPFRYAFLSERKVNNVPGIDPKTARDIRTAAVIGAGTMGAGIAIALVEAGIEVQLLDLNAEALERGVAHCAKTWDRSVDKGRLTEAKRDAMSRLCRPRPITPRSPIAIW